MARRYRAFFEDKTVRGRGHAARQRIREQIDPITRDLKAAKLSIGDIAKRYNVNVDLLRKLAEGSMGINLEARQAKVDAWRYEQRAKAADAKLDMDYIEKLITDMSMTTQQICTTAGITRTRLQRVFESLGIDPAERTKRMREHREHLREKGLLEQSEQGLLERSFMAETLSGDGFSLQWLKRPWRTA